MGILGTLSHQRHILSDEATLVMDSYWGDEGK